MLEDVKDLDEDRNELLLLVEQVRAILDHPNTHSAVHNAPDPVLRALQGMEQALNDLHKVVRNLAKKIKLVKFLLAGNFLAKLRQAARKLYDSMGVLRTVLSINSANDNQHIMEQISHLQSSIDAMRLEVLRKFEQHSSAAGNELNKAMVLHIERLQSDIADGVVHEVSQQLRGALSKVLPPDLHVLPEDEQALAEELHELRKEALELKATKQQQEALYMEQVIAALSSTVDPAVAPPDAYVCKITKEVMHDPVVTSLGHTYERWAIEFWLQTHGTEPCTGELLPNKVLVPNKDLQRAIEQWKQGHGLAEDDARAGLPNNRQPPAGGSTSTPQAEDTPSTDGATDQPAERTAATSASAQDSSANGGIYQPEQHAVLAGNETNLPWQPYLHDGKLDLTPLCSEPGTGGPAVVDFGGKTVVLQCPAREKQLVIKRCQLTIRNGTLQLPAGMTILVDAVGVTFQNLQLLGENVVVPDPTHGIIVAVKGPLQVHQCTINAGCPADTSEQYDSRPFNDGRPAGTSKRYASCIVLQQSCGVASIRECCLTGGETGLMVWGRDEGGDVVRVDLTESTATHNRGAGFAASGTRARMIIQKGCKSEDNRQCGYFVEESAYMHIHEGTLSSGNRCAGFEARSHGVMEIGAKCIAERNAYGFVAIKSGKLTTSRDCEAINNQRTGFYAVSGGSLSLGHNCLAANNHCGYCSCRQGKLVTGNKCTADGNAGAGYLVQNSGTMKIQANCRAVNNDYGTCELGLTSTLKIGSSFWYDGNKNEHVSKWFLSDWHQLQYGMF